MTLEAYAALDKCLQENFGGIVSNGLDEARFFIKGAVKVFQENPDRRFFALGMEFVLPLDGTRHHPLDEEATENDVNDDQGNDRGKDTRIDDLVVR